MLALLPGATAMPAHRLAVLALGFAVLLALDAPSAAQPKAKAKTGFPLVADPADFVKPGDPLSIRTPVQRPVALKGVRSWTIETKRHRWFPTKIAVSPDGKRLATGGYDGIIRIWNTETGQFERALVGHDSYVYGLDWSPDGNYLASAGSFNATARVWDMKTGHPVRVLKGHKGYVSHVAWSPDGTRLLTAGGTSGFVTLWDVAASKQLQTVEYGNPIYCIAFARSGDHVATSAAKAGTYIADANTLKTIHSLKESLDDATAVAFSPDSRHLAAGSSKQTIVYDVESGRLTRKLELAGASVVYTPAGGLLVAPSGGAVVPHTPNELVPGTALTLSKDGSDLFALVGGQVTHWSLAKNASVRTVTVGESSQLSWGSNRPLLTGVGTSNTPALWDPATGKLLAKLEGHTAAVMSAGWSPGGKSVATGSADKTARVWDAPAGKLARTLAGHADAVNAVAVCGDGKVATGSADRKVRIFPATGDQPAHTLTGHKQAVTAVAWSRDNRTLASGGNDRDVILWTADTGKQIRSIDHASEVQCLAFSPDGKSLAVGSADDRLRIYQVTTGKRLAELEMAGSPPNVSAVAWSSDSQFVLAGRGHHTVPYWSPKANKDVQNISTMAPVAGVALSADGKTLVGGSLDRAVRFWDAGTARLKLTLIADTAQILAIGADGNYRCPDEAESELVAVVQTDKGHETLSLKEFAQKYGFRNNPGLAR